MRVGAAHWHGNARMTDRKTVLVLWTDASAFFAGANLGIHSVNEQIQSEAN